MFSSNTTQVSSGGYQISRSLRFNSADSAYLSRTPASATNQKTWTFSAWVKRSKLSTTQYIFSAGEANPWAVIGFQSDDTLQFILNAGTSDTGIATTAVYRDVSAWYHIVAALDTTQATNTNRIKLYVNGIQITAGTFNYPTQDSTWKVNSVILHSIGARQNGLQTFDGYMTEVNFIDGQALTPSSFGETNAQTGVWQPKAYSGSYGTNGFYLNFSDNSNTTAATLGKDYSGNGNNWTPNNFSVTAGAGNDSLVDSPTAYGTDTGVGGEVRGNYATLNPLINTSGYATLSNGNLDVVPDSTHYPMVPATFGMTTGKWYWEYTLGSSGNGGRLLGIVNGSASTTNYVGSNSNGWGYYGGSGQKYTNNSGSAYGATFTNSDVIGVAFDADAGTLVFYKNGTSQGTAFSSLTSGPYFPAWSAGDAGQTGTTSLNFGQRPFAYTAPSGYKALCTQNLPTPTIGATTATQANQYFTPVLWTGNGSSQTITTVGFQADLVWIKARSSAYSHQLQDAVRGFNNGLSSNATGAEFSGSANYGYINNLTSSGYGVLGGALGSQHTNENGVTYVAWNWKANGSGSSNTAGSITSTVSANTTSGFSVVTYSGNSTASSTVGHGLGVTPSMIIVKKRNGSTNWPVSHSAYANTSLLLLDTTNALASTGTILQRTSSTVFTVGDSSNYDPTNITGGTYVAYCFAEVAGYSKFGSYTGNGSTDGPFVFTNMRPAFLMIKRTDTAGYPWVILDNKRNTYNPENLELYPNTSGAEASGGTTYIEDFLSNGFKIRQTDGTWNASGGTYIYAAFAESPFKYSLAR